MRCVVCSECLGLALFGSLAHAQGFPCKPITLIVP